MCEYPYLLSTKLLAALYKTNPDLLKPLQPAMAASSCSFGQAQGKTGFILRNTPVLTQSRMQELFFAGCTGEKGKWTAEGKARVKLWAVCFANTLAQPEAVEAQVNHVAPLLKRFIMPEAAKALFPADRSLDKGYLGAVQAAFISFSTNLPAVADKHLRKALSETRHPRGTLNWATDILRELTFGPGIAIYPERYGKIRPKLEQHFEVDLPDYASELKTLTGSDEIDLTSTKQLQEVLIRLGYDLGPKGADGIAGRKTDKAIRDFQTSEGLKSDGIVGKQTTKALLQKLG
jgi:hypothetical protein